MDNLLACSAITLLYRPLQRANWIRLDISESYEWLFSRFAMGQTGYVDANRPRMNLPRTFVLTVDRPIARYNETTAHLNEMGIKWERYNGFDNQLCQLLPVQTFDLDRAGEKIGPKHIAATLSHYSLWKCMSMQPDDSFLVLEYDVRFVHDWQACYEEAMRVMPGDWDVIFMGSCCIEGRPKTHIGMNVYEVKYPLCGHSIMYRKKALPILLREHQRIYQPLDVALFYQSLPLLKVYTILPAIVEQHGTYAAP